MNAKEFMYEFLPKTIKEFDDFYEGKSNTFHGHRYQGKYKEQYKEFVDSFRDFKDGKVSFVSVVVDGGRATDGYSVKKRLKNFVRVFFGEDCAIETFYTSDRFRMGSDDDDFLERYYKLRKASTKDFILVNNDIIFKPYIWKEKYFDDIYVYFVYLRDNKYMFFIDFYFLRNIIVYSDDKLYSKYRVRNNYYCMFNLVNGGRDIKVLNNVENNEYLKNKILLDTSI